MATPATIKTSTASRNINRRLEETQLPKAVEQDLTDYSGKSLKKAIAAAIASTEEGSKLMDSIAARLSAQEKASRPRKK